jgi:hypothetical protein
MGNKRPTRHAKEVKKWVEERGKENTFDRIVRGVVENVPPLKQITRNVNKQKHMESPDIIKTDNPEYFKKKKKNLKNYIALLICVGLFCGNVFAWSGWDTGKRFLIHDVQTVAITNAVTTQIIPTSSFVKFTTTGAVTLTCPVVKAPISTTTAVAGQYLILTTTCTNGLTFATGTAHYIIASSSPMVIGTNKALTMIFNGTYWICLSTVTP